MKSYNGPLFVLTAASAGGLAEGQSSSYDCTFSDEVSIHRSGTVFLQHFTNVFENTFTMRIRYTDGNAWIGIGANYIDQPWMAPAYAVMGRVHTELDGLASVQRYWLEEEYEDGSGTIPYADVNAHLKPGWSFTQTDTDEGEASVLEFTHDLQILDEDGGTDKVEYTFAPESTWIWAVGLPENQWEGVHSLHGSFKLNLFDSCRIVEPEVVVVEEPVMVEEEPVVVGMPVQTPVETEAEVMEEAETETTATTNEDEAPEERPVPTTAAPTITTSTADTTEDPEPAPDVTTEEAETINLVESNSNSNSNTITNTNTHTNTNTVSSANSGQNTIVFIESEASTTRPLWIAHGIMMAIAWGVCAPIAIGASILRKMSFLQTNGNWLKIHSILLTMLAVLTLVGCLLAVVATNKEDTNPSHFTEDSHHTIGLTIFILVIVQVLAGYFRPGPSSNNTSVARSDSDLESESVAEKQKGAEKAAEGEADASESEVPLSQLQPEVDAEGFPLKYNTTEITHRYGDCSTAHGNDNEIEFEDETSPIPKKLSNDSGGDDATCSTNEDSPNKGMATEATEADSAPATKSIARQCWEYGHRLVGMALLGLAWYNCHTGIILQAENYYEDDEQQLLKIFWWVTGGIAGGIFLLGYVFRV